MRSIIAWLFAVSTAYAASPIGQALPCGKVGVAGGLGGGTDMTRVTIDTKRFPDAVCNDGTPAVMYVARYTSDASRNKWVIFLQGGGSCTDGQTCAQRWCSIDTNYGMDKMGTSLAKASIRANGVLDPRAENQFGSWNRVLVYYCSSDEWSGTKTSTQHAAMGAGAVDYVISFKGSRIVDAVVETLRRNARMRAVRIGSSSLTLPDLDAATDILFAGSSGGGNGVKNNGDRLAAKMKAINSSINFKVAIDASYGPQEESIDYTKSVMCAHDPVQCYYEPSHKAEYDQTDVALYGARLDDSCLAWHAAHQPGTEWRCIDGGHVIANHITTPLYIRQDEQDSNIGGKYADAGLMTYQQFGMAVEQQLRDLALLNTTAEEGSVRNGGAPLVTPGVFGPQCTNHESFTNDSAFFDVRVSGLSFHDTLWNWWSGGQPQVAIHAFTPPGGAVAGCPPGD